MRKSESDFFEKAVLLICGDLEIEKSLFECLIFFKLSMPAHTVFLQIYEEQFESMRTIAVADEKGGKKTNLLTPLSEQAKELLKRAAQMDFPATIIQNDPEKYTISREMLAYHGLKASSLMIMNLSTDRRPFGSLVITCESREKFTEEQKNLISLLKEPLIIAMSNILKHREILALKDLLADNNRFLNKELYRISGSTIIGADHGLKNVMKQVGQVAMQDTPVLLLGETGVGKDVIANAIHYSSGRREGTLVSVNCGAIPETLIDSELFGHEKGAFTNAYAQKRGRFERADNGTIFLDEIGELPLNIQVRLLRVIQNREIERVGGTQNIPVNIRIIAATNQNLEKMIAEKTFREDLWFRLNVFPITIPPLRERRGDIPALVQHFVSLKAKELKLPGIPELADGEASILRDYGWPGNVREVENIIERALILNPTGSLTFNNLLSVSDGIEPVSNQEAENIVPLDSMIKKHIIRALKRSRGKIHGPGGTADILGLNPSTLRNKMNKLGIIYGRNKQA